MHKLGTALCVQIQVADAVRIRVEEHQLHFVCYCIWLAVLDA